MPCRLRTTRKLWDHESHGHIGKHWMHVGGQGNAGVTHYHRINFDTQYPGHFRKLGLRHDHLNRNKSFCLDKLWTLVSELTWANAAKNKTGGAPIIVGV